jgi:hypothetical protein
MMNSSITSIDSTLLKAKGCVWNNHQFMKKGAVPRSGIDTDPRWGYSHTRGCVFGYKLHLTSTTAAAASDLIVPLTADDVTTANAQDNQMYVTLTSSSSEFSLPSVLDLLRN